MATLEQVEPQAMAFDRLGRKLKKWDHVLFGRSNDEGDVLLIAGVVWAIPTDFRVVVREMMGAETELYGSQVVRYKVSTDD